MRLCPCGFANPDDATRCTACGNALTSDGSTELGDPSTTGLRPFAQDDTVEAERSAQDDTAKAEATDSVLLLEDVRSGEVVRIPPPGGILGRAGDFAPDLFSPRVSGVHAVVTTDCEGRWAIEHLGRNASALERGGVWSDLRTGAPQPLFGGEMLKLADMVFRVRVSAGEEPTRSGAVDATESAAASACTTGTTNPVTAEVAAVQNAGEAAVQWSVRCPVCGTEYAAEGPESRIATCTFCKDPLDARQIARVAARPVPAP